MEILLILLRCIGFFEATPVDPQTTLRPALLVRSDREGHDLLYRNEGAPQSQCEPVVYWQPHIPQTGSHIQGHVSPSSGREEWHLSPSGLSGGEQQGGTESACHSYRDQ